MNTKITNPEMKSAAKKIAAVLSMAFALEANAQGVSEVITDYNGYWKSSTTAINSVKPDNSHNLLSFSYAGTRYSTGVNDALLTCHGETFTAANFKALPLENYNGVVNGNTKIGMGALADGVANGTPAGNFPTRDLGKYLNDGINGLDLGTCIANFPVGTMFLSISNLHESNIGDGVPDILVTQTADPSSKYDRYAFTDINGNIVGNTLDVILTSINPVGNWTADFFEATGATNLTSGYTQTSRGIRLWAADLSAFGINASNIGQIAYFKIVLSGDSDLAFVAYNTTTITLSSTLDQDAQQAIGASRITRTIDRNQTNTVSVYPNPAVSTVNVSHPTAKGDEKIAVYNMSGILFTESTVAKSSVSTRLNLSSLTSGSYLVAYMTDAGKTAQTLVVSH